MNHKIFYVCHQTGPDEDDYIEYEYKVEVEGWSPYDPGVCSGPVESCYPPEGGEVEFSEDDISRRRADDDKAEWETVPFSIFMEGYAENYKDDPPDKPYRKNKWDKAQEALEEAMYLHCEEEAAGAYEDAMERKGEEMRERLMFGDDW